VNAFLRMVVEQADGKILLRLQSRPYLSRSRHQFYRDLAEKDDVPQVLDQVIQMRYRSQAFMAEAQFSSTWTRCEMSYATVRFCAPAGL
jgi:hypothetical protein